MIRTVSGAESEIKRWDIQLPAEKKFGLWYAYIGTDGKEKLVQGTYGFTGHQSLTYAMKQENGIWKLEVGRHLGSPATADNGTKQETGSGALVSMQLPDDFAAMLNDGSQSVTMGTTTKTKTLPVELLRHTVKSADGSKSMVLVFRLAEQAAKDAT